MRIRPARALLAASSVALLAATAAPAHADAGVQQDPPNWGLDRIDQREGGDQLDQRYHYAGDGEGVTVYVIDSGVDGTHPDFGGRVSGGKDFVDGDEHPVDLNGHGTSLAGVAAGQAHGVAKAARVVPVRVLDQDGGGNGLSVLAGIDWVANNARQPAVAVIGIGGPASEVVDEAVRGLAEVMPVAVPAGGTNSDAGQSSPGRVPEVLTVGASDRTDAVVPDSNFGAAVDLYAPGADVLAPALRGGTSELTGTSVAAAHVAGVAALYRAAHPDATPQQVTEAIVAGATPDGLTGVRDGTANRVLHAGPVPAGGR
ncbi:S8 family peptidase [Prauserella cavernicola]|uniref:S8 family peptidase n=1 Tax=Prauserella cavernicola TaxID=2800127 RepID=A0A934QUZ6_9PSEU|nr:S8 family peptidase [Prauserella cavernicola]MBK1786843.1 S8 family peptidase [Prauserella cavernicola]